jgi:hypothetical protein
MVSERKNRGTGVTPGLARVEEPVAAKGFPWFQTPAPPLRRNAISGRRKYFLTTVSILVMMSHNEAVKERNIPG